MPLTFVPNKGTLLMCNFTTGFQPPEMVKIRPVIVISPRRRDNAQTCIVVPLSTQKPTKIKPWHINIAKELFPAHSGLRRKDT